MSVVAPRHRLEARQPLARRAADARRHAADLRQHRARHHRGDGLGRGAQRHAVLLLQRRGAIGVGGGHAVDADRQRRGSSRQRFRHPRAPPALPAERRRHPAPVQARRHLPEAQVTARSTSRASATSATTPTAAGTIKEWGFGVKVELDALGMTSSRWPRSSSRAVAQNLPRCHASNSATSSPRSSLGFLPAGPFGLYDIRALVADNMAPNLDSTFPDGEGMALLKWHQNHDQRARTCRRTARWPTGSPRTAHSRSAWAAASRSTARGAAMHSRSSSSSRRARPTPAC